MTQWVFAKLDPAVVRRDPNETQLFKAEQAGDDEYAGTDALVREILQNSIDAATGNGPVRVRLALHPNAEMPSRASLAEHFRRLESPLKRREVDFDSDGVTDLTQWYEKQWAESSDFKEQLIDLLDSSKFGTKEYTP